MSPDQQRRAARDVRIKEKIMKKEYRPMLATLVDQPFDSKGWVYETKWDGFRLVAEVSRDSVRIFSRNGIEVTARYPSIAQALRTITEPCVIDGELVALDAKGRSRFQLLQNALRDASTKLRVLRVRHSLPGWQGYAPQAPA
jgi:bifunctional non-homologous end joining protein LigD